MNLAITFQIKRSWGWQTLEAASPNDNYSSEAAFTFFSPVGQGGGEFWPEIFSGKLGACPIPPSQRGKWPSDFDPYTDASPDFDVYVCDGEDHDDEEECEELYHERPLIEMGKPLGWVTWEQFKAFRWLTSVATVTVYSPLETAKEVPFGEMPSRWWKDAPSYATVVDSVEEAKGVEGGPIFVRFRGGMSFGDLTEGAYPAALETLGELFEDAVEEGWPIRLLFGEVG